MITGGAYFQLKQLPPLADDARYDIAVIPTTIIVIMVHDTASHSHALTSTLYLSDNALLFPSVLVQRILLLVILHLTVQSLVRVCLGGAKDFTIIICFIVVVPFRFFCRTRCVSNKPLWTIACLSS